MRAGSDRPGPEHLSVYGSLLLRGAIAAASADDRPAALGLLEEASDAANRLGQDGNFYWTAFGPVNVLLHRVHVATRLGDAGTALAYAAKISPELVTVAERRASLWLDMAQAYLQRRWAEQAVTALRAEPGRPRTAGSSSPKAARAAGTYT
ncbi:MAG TPA: hypothetical protein VNF47_20985 [Streptosporangiaceae bacterium]|nr:hypothetical protein [Streptosporangiaceae bacterium]